MAVPQRHYDRNSPAGGTYFVTSHTAGKRALLQTERSARLFIDLLYGCRTEGHFPLHEFVVMPNHFHALITPGQSIGEAMRFIKGRFFP